MATKGKPCVTDLPRGNRDNDAPMSITIKTGDEIDGMRIAGRLASEVLDYITPFVKPGVTTDELDRLCHNYMVDVQGCIPAPLNYAPGGHTPYPKSICTSINQQICHGVPSDRALKDGDIVNLDITVIKDGWHGDTSRMFIVGEGSVWATSATPSRPSLKTRASRWCASSAATASAASSTKSPRCCTTAAPARSKS
jgi:methionine aminopeptidase